MINADNQSKGIRFGCADEYVAYDKIRVRDRKCLISFQHSKLIAYPIMISIDDYPRSCLPINRILHSDRETPLPTDGHFIRN